VKKKILTFFLIMLTTSSYTRLVNAGTDTICSFLAPYTEFAIWDDNPLSHFIVHYDPNTGSGLSGGVTAVHNGFHDAALINSSCVNGHVQLTWENKVMKGYIEGDLDIKNAKPTDRGRDKTLALRNVNGLSFLKVNDEWLRQDIRKDIHSDTYKPHPPH